MASHTKSMYPFSESLAAKGHDVFMLQLLEGDHEKAKSKKLNDIYIIVPGAGGAHGVDGAMLWTPVPTKPEGLIFPWYGATTTCRKVLNDTKLFEQFSNVVLGTKWDLIIVDSIFAACGLVASQMSEAPFIDFSTSFVLPNSMNLLGAQWNGAFMPLFRPPGKFDADSFYDRFWNTYDLYVIYVVNRALEYLLPRWVDHPLSTNISLRNLNANAALAFGSMPHELDYTHGKSSNVIEMDGSCPTKAGTLPENYLSFVDDPTSKGTILFAMGHFADFQHAPPIVLQSFVDAFNELTDYRIIWQYVSKGAKPKVGPNVMLDPWIPQASILFHNKTALFISHMGFKSIREAICAKVPIVALPMFAEQSRNAAIARKRGFGEYINKMYVTKENVLQALNKVLHNPSYKLNVGKVQDLLSDKIVDSIELGTFWVDFILKHENYALKFLKQKVQTTCFLEYSSGIGIFGLIITLATIAY